MIAGVGHQQVGQVTVVTSLVSPAERRGEEALDQPSAVPIVPLRHDVAAATRGEVAPDPLHQGAGRRPALGLERRDGHGRDVDGLIDPGTGIRRVERFDRDVRIVGSVQEHLDQVVKRAVDDGAVLGQGADVVVDVDHGGQHVP